MAATRYTVAATANHAAREMANLKAAKAAADRRAAADNEIVTVTTVASGRVSYTAVPAPADLRIVPQAEVEALFAAEDRAARTEVASVMAALVAKTAARAEAAQTPAPRKPKAARREALGQAAVPAWELLYDKPRQDAQVGRRDGKYALICTLHKTAHRLGKLVEERALRQGDRAAWCADCGH